MAKQNDTWVSELISQFNGAPIVKTLGYNLDAVGDGWAVTRLAAEERHIHQGGIVHGGVLLTMADAAFTAALISTLSTGEDVMITEMKINFMRPTWPGGYLEARATVTYRGKRVGFGEVNVINADGKAVAKCIGTAIYRESQAPTITQPLQ